MAEWTQSEIDFVTKNYGKLTSVQIAKHLGRSTSTVRTYCSRHGIAKKNYHWDKEDDEYILNHYGNVSFEAMSKRTGRSAYAIRKRMYVLVGSSSLIERADDVTVADAARLIGLTRTAIHNWIKDGLKSRKINGSRFINIDDLIAFMQANPERWQAVKCQKWYFENYDWYHKKLLEEREAAHKERWGKYA